jgi:hypothetical protein
MAARRLRRWKYLLGNVAQNLSLTVVVVAETPEVLGDVEHIWANLNLRCQLCTGLLTSDGQFQPIRPLYQP